MSKTITAGGKTYKPEEFVCGWCNTPLVLDTYYTIEGKNVCQSCRNKERCASCGFLITETKYVTVDHLTYHPDCFRCSECFEELQKFHLEDGKLFCTACLGGSTRSVDPENSCGKCNLPLSGSILKALGKRYHEDCFVCHSCFGPFPDDEFVNIEGNPFCDKCVDNRSYLRSTAHIKATGNPAGGAGGAGGADRGVPGASSSSGPGTNAGYGSGAPGSGAGAGYGSGAPGSGAGYGSGAPGSGSGAGAGGYGADRGLPSGAGGSGAGGYGSGAPGSGSGASGSGHGSGAPGSGSGAGGYGSGAPGSGSGASGSGAPGSGSGGDGYGADRGLPSGAAGSGSGAGGNGSGAPGSGSGASGSGAPGSGAGYGSGAPGSGSGAGGNGSGAPGSGSSYGSGAPGSGSSGSGAPGAGTGAGGAGAGGASRGIGGDDEDAYLDASNLPPKGPSKFDQKKKIKYGGGIKEEKRQRDYKSKAALGFCSETEHLKDLESLGYKTISRKKGL